MTGKIKYHTVFLALLLFPYNNSVFAHCPLIKLSPSDANANDRFGISVAIDGNFAVIGAYGCDINGIADSGAAYVFEHTGSTWLQRQKLTASDASAGAQFGRSVAIEANTIAIGSYLDNNTGSAYIFTRSAGVWSQQAKLTALDAAGGDYFGYSVALDANIAVIGAYECDINGIDNAGAAYVFSKTDIGWVQQQKLTPSNAQKNDRFGYSAAIDTNAVLIGSYCSSPFGIRYAGSVYYFTRTAGVWSQQAVLTASDPNGDNYFGCSVALDANIAVIGAYECDINGIADAGAAYVFYKTDTGWVQQQKLFDTIDPCEEEDFGRSVALEGSAIFVGCPNNRVDGNQTGSVFEFVRTGQSWMQNRLLSADDSNDGDNFGFSTAVSGRNLIVGAHFNANNGASSGAAYAFNNTSADFDGDCDVDFADFALLGGSWRQNNPSRDIAPSPSGDGIVDIYDLAVLCNDWLTGK
ncbi:MAG: FG-GAP repeat protein [Sedimentisphaerales bacterium]